VARVPSPPPKLPHVRCKWKWTKQFSIIILNYWLLA
jgi:hypothetical protein